MLSRKLGTALALAAVMAAAIVPSGASALTAPRAGLAKAPTQKLGVIANIKGHSNGTKPGMTDAMCQEYADLADNAEQNFEHEIQNNHPAEEAQWLALEKEIIAGGQAHGCSFSW